MGFGSGIETASGVLHEVDLVARRFDLTAIIELKNRKGALPAKNDVIVFFSKIIDYVAANPTLVSNDLCLAFMSSGSYEPSGVAACLGLGIHPVGAELRPLPILVNNAMIMEAEIGNGLELDSSTRNRFEDLCSELNNLSSALNDTWMDARCSCVASDKILIRALPSLATIDLGQQLRRLNADCADVLRELRRARSHP